MSDGAGPQEPLQAYNNEEFMQGREARALRILSEYIEPQARFEQHQVHDTIVVMGSARTPSREQAEAEVAAAQKGQGDLKRAESRLEMSVYYEAARELAFRLTEWSKGLSDPERRFVICTGGGPGIMEAANRGASEARGLNIGLSISIPVEEFHNPHVTRSLGFKFHYFFMRKFWFAYLAKAVVVFPGGFGTLDELFELLTLVQTEKVTKRMPLVLFGEKYWSEVINFEALVRHGTIDAKDIDLVLRTDSVEAAYDVIVSELTEHALPTPGPTL
ncbi:MAG TPA: LOG family protein [Alphaproteobacteria bacterium]|jgi:hypothetical protein|nr:LOG family protein [Alphaproteobacteria bacterium]